MTQYDAARYQPMRKLTDEEYADLKDDIGVRGQLYPILIDEDGNIIDGHNREQICRELGIAPRYEVKEGLSDDEKWNMAVAAGTKRRQLSVADRQAMIRTELERDKTRSDRQIAKLLGVDHKTVARQRHAMFPEEFPAPSIEDIIEDYVGRLQQISADIDRENGLDNFKLGDLALEVAPADGSQGVAHGSARYEQIVREGAALVRAIVDRYVKVSNLTAGFFERYFVDYPELLSLIERIYDWTSWRIEMQDWMGNADVRAAYVRFAPYLSLLEQAEANEVAAAHG